MPPDVAGPVATRRAPHDRAARVRFRRAVTLTLMTLVLPGSAQLVAGNRRVGRIALRIWLAMLLVALVTGLVVLAFDSAAYWLVANTSLLGLVRVVLTGLAVGWATLLVDAWRIGRPLSLAQNQRLAVVGLNATLCFLVAGGLLFGAHLVGVQRQLILTMFGDGSASEAHEGRYNVLLLGGDAGAGRWGLRPDSITLASIDARTGRTVLVGLPRNLQDFPFAEGSPMAEAFPRGFDCDGCYLNGVSTWAEDNPGLFGGSATPGIDATVSAVEGITGLPVNYWVMINLRGFRDIVDAVGGVRLTVREPIPVGGLGEDVTREIPPGRRVLDGVDTLWYARAREGSDDYSRMARQKCVMQAMLTQLSPSKVLMRFDQIADASTTMVSTSLPASEVDRFIGLALKAKAQQVSTVSLVPPLVDTADPDVDAIRDTVQRAVDRAEGDAPASRPRRAEAPDRPVTGGSLGSLQDGYDANDAADLAAAC